jgi:hypothetical protein
MKPKFTYVSYDYSFLRKKEDTWEILFPNAVKVAAKTIGFDMVETRTMDEPTGQLFWIDPIMTDEEPSATTATATTYTTDDSPTMEFVRNWDMLLKDYRAKEEMKRRKTSSYFKKYNFFKNLHRNRYGKKI